MEHNDVALAIKTLVEIALSLSALSSLVTVGLTGFFRENFPAANPRWFSIPCGSIVTCIAYFATLPVPDSVAAWMALLLICVVGGLIPSGLFDAGVNLLRKAQARTWSIEADD